MTILPARVAAAFNRGRIRLLTLLVTICCCLTPTTPAAAQLRPIAIRDATLLTGDGRTIEGGTVVLKGGTIDAVGRKVKAPLLARKIAARGKYVTPGLIDVYGTLALRYVSSGDQATAKAADAFDAYAKDEIEAAWRDGVTAAYVPARGGNGIGGLGAVIRFQARDNPDGAVLRDEAALSAIVGVSARDGPLARVAVARELRKRFKAANEYREAWEDYEEELKEYEEKLTERAKKKEKEESSKEKSDKKDDNKNDKKKRGALSSEQKREKRGDAKPGDKKKKDEKKDELKKPAEPKKDRNAEVLLRVIDGELLLRVEAHHPADILNVLEVAEEYDLALLLEGASGAHLVAERLAELDVPVVLWGEPTPVAYVGGTRRHARPDAAAILRQAGVDVYFGSGVIPANTAGPQLALRAARAASYGFEEDAAFEAITLGAARLLGVEKQIGRLKKGLQGDVVVWSDHPFAPGAKVERVFVGGQEVYRADSE